MRETRHRFLHLPDLVLGEIVEALLSERAHLGRVALARVLSLGLEAGRSLDQVREIGEATADELAQALRGLGVETRAVEIIAELFESARDLGEPELLAQSVAELPFLKGARATRGAHAI